MSEGRSRVSHDRREKAIAEIYCIAYARSPDDAGAGEAGAALAAEIVAAEETGRDTALGPGTAPRAD